MAWGTTSSDDAHEHGFWQGKYGGGNAPHNIVQPYIAVNRWKRTA